MPNLGNLTTLTSPESGVLFEHVQLSLLFQYFWGASGHQIWEMLNLKCPSADYRLDSPKKMDSADDYNNSRA